MIHANPAEISKGNFTNNKYLPFIEYMELIHRLDSASVLNRVSEDRPVLSLERAPHIDRTATFMQKQISGHEPQTGLDTKRD
jgi:hypothetical protein